MFMAYAARLAMLAGVAALAPATPLVRDQVDVIELNHVHDSEGRPVLRQLIFWDWHRGDARLHVVAWRTWKEDQPRPARDWERGGYALVWHDGQVLRLVEAAAFYETWTQFDPEISNRQLLSPERRRGLTTALLPSDAKGTHSPSR